MWKPKEGCCLHKILPRTLQHLAATDTTTDAKVDLVSLLNEVGIQADEFPSPDTSVPGHDASSWYDLLQEALDSKELSFAELNRKRKRLTFQAFQDDLMSLKTIALERLVEPNAHRMYMFFGRSDAIATLGRLPESMCEERRKLEEKCLDPVLCLGHCLPLTKVDTDLQQLRVWQAWSHDCARLL